MATILAAEDVSKRYGAVEALRGLTLSAPSGGVYGLLGPNGAGKSTLLRLAIGMVRPTSGRIALFGEPVSPRSLRRVGALIESPRFYPYLTGAESLTALALASGLACFDPKPLLARVGLSDAGRRRVDGYSLGMKQRLGIAGALIGDPELVILDEPTNGMDPAGIQEVRTLIRALADREGRTVVLSSHLLDEVQRTCDRVAILDKGRLSAEGPIGELLQGGERLRIEARPLELVLKVLGARGEREGEAVLAAIERSEAPALIRALVEGGVDVTEARWTGRDLESVFFEQTGSA